MDTFAELGRVEAVRKLFEGTGYKPFEEPLGAEMKAGDKSVSTLKTLLEGVDFDLVYFPLKHLGYKAVALASGELLAAMAHPRTLSVTLGISAKLDYEQIKELWGGVVKASKEFGFVSLSLELQPSRNGLAISVAATGAASKLTRVRTPKPQSRDLLCVSGSLGAAYFGLQVLERGKKQFAEGRSNEEEMKTYRMLVGSYLKPELPAGVVAQLEDAQIIPSAGLFVGKGLSDAVLRLTRATGLGAKIYAEKIPFEGGSFELGRKLDIDPVSAAMNGGEDCRLLFAVPILKLEDFRRDFQTFDIVGHLAQSEVGAVLVSPDGLEHPMTAQGW